MTQHPSFPLPAWSIDLSTYSSMCNKWCLSIGVEWFFLFFRTSSKVLERCDLLDLFDFWLSWLCVRWWWYSAGTLWATSTWTSLWCSSTGSWILSMSRDKCFLTTTVSWCPWPSWCSMVFSITTVWCTVPTSLSKDSLCPSTCKLECFSSWCSTTWCSNFGCSISWWTISWCSSYSTWIFARAASPWKEPCSSSEWCDLSSFLSSSANKDVCLPL